MEMIGGSNGLQEESDDFDFEEMYLRSSISDELHISFFGIDNASQTDVSEIMDLKELTNTMQSLAKSVKDLKKDKVMQKNILQAEYKQKIEEHGQKLYEKMTFTVQDLEETFKKKIAVLRRSYQQQLIDSLAVLKANYKGFEGEDGHIGDVSSAKFKDLKKKLLERDSIIQSLEAHILELEQRDNTKQIIFEAENDPEKERLEEENKEMKERIDELYDNVQNLEDVLKQKEKRIRSLDQDVGSMKQKMEKDQQTIEKLLSAQEKLKIQLENEKLAAENLLRQQKEEMESLLQSKLKEKDKELNRQKEEMEALMKKRLMEKEKEKERIQQDYENKILLEAQRQTQQQLQQVEILQRKQKSARKRSPLINSQGIKGEQEVLLAQIQKHELSKEDQEKDLERLRRELERVNKMWEKKFDILKQSFHAIKDEMFLRQSLQRQSLSLQKVSVSYMTGESIGDYPPCLAPKNSYSFSAYPLVCNSYTNYIDLCIVSDKI
ncbi:hypothetical protein GDO86_011894 [Hymenochirus boettgeri]|uniref:DUF4709 domain-containing protein n=1 Tax=Hymenochirus boettgeri TaxID=247094 RepID=A0A8T2JIX5_9PIPI|nr:hypothetical protein GDO86_011894 [Hymenochirus boettgeri]